MTDTDNELTGAPVAAGEAPQNDSARADGGEGGKRRRRRRGGRGKGERSAAQGAAGDWDAASFEVPEAEGKVRFHDFDLPDELMRAIADLGFQYCTPIQGKVLPATLDGYDAIGKAQTGTGKTAAFLITIITDLLNNPIAEQRYMGEPRAVILAPTRELVMQIAKDAEGLCKYSGLNVVTLIGGADYQKQLQQVENNLVDIVVATPGRLIDFFERGDMHLDLVEILVLDEADRMLDMGFIPQVKRIVRQTPRKTHRQTLLFSATFTQDILNLADQWTEDPVTVEVEPERVANESVEQIVYIAANEEKYAILRNVLASEAATSVMVFANRRDQVRKLHERLERAKFKVGILSGDIPQGKRTRTLEEFRDGTLNVLVATDVAGRGIHVEGVSHVINYDLPEEPEDYVHRIGRTGRAGATGISISFATEDDAFRLGPIEQLLGAKLPCVQPPAELLVDPRRKSGGQPAAEPAPAAEVAAEEPAAAAAGPAAAESASAGESAPAAEARVEG